ncbi:ankyrin repeat-containing domain protein, partial [Clohesyomyces aquaticus]
LAWAAENGNEVIVKLLVISGKVNTNSTDQSGWTPLWWALQKRNKAVVKLLLETGMFDIDSRDQIGRTPLSWAAENGHEAVVSCCSRHARSPEIEER